jgi:hypothetical protein
MMSQSVIVHHMPVLDAVSMNVGDEVALGLVARMTVGFAAVTVNLSRPSKNCDREKRTLERKRHQRRHHQGDGKLSKPWPYMTAQFRGLRIGPLTEYI